MRKSEKPVSKTLRESGKDAATADESVGSRSVRRALVIFELMLQRGNLGLERFL